MKHKFFLCAVSVLFVTIANCQNQLSPWNDPTPGGATGPFHNFNVYSHNTALDGSYVNFNSIENTKGKRYLFDDWAKGTVTTSRGEVLATDTFYYNLDKMNSSLLVTMDKKNIIAVNKSDINSFTLSDGKEKYHLERIDAINPQGFLQVLTQKDKDYILYKYIKTKFEKSDYHTDGLMESGKPYDEYLDEYKYYVVFPDNKGFKEVTLKTKVIKDVFGENQKAGEFISSHKGNSIDENYLIDLVNYLNQ